MANFFEDLRKRVEKNAKGVHSSIMAESQIATVGDWVKSPTYDLNRIISGDLFKALPTRQLVGIVGMEGCMKSSLSVLMAADAQKQGFKPIIIDTERGITNDFCKRWGLDPANTLYFYTPWEHEIRTILAQIKESGEEKLFIILDSIGGIDRIKMYEDALGGDPKADQGQLQKSIKTDLKLLLNIAVMQNSIGIITGHQYPAMAAVPTPDIIAGGRAVRLFPTILLQLRKYSVKGSDKSIVGQEIKVTTLKNRLYPPFQDATLHLDYNSGLDPLAGIVELGVAANIIEQNGSFYKYKDKSIGQGLTNATKNIVEYPEILTEINGWLTKTGYSTINEEVRAMETVLQREDSEETLTDVEDVSPKGKRVSRKK